MRHLTEFILIAAKDRCDGIGFDNKLQVKIPEDLARFKSLTHGEVVVMGRNTWDSLPDGKLPGRTVWVISRSAKASELKPADRVFPSLEDFILECQNQSIQRVFIAGGGELFSRILELDLASAMELTEVAATLKSDCTFPKFDEKRWLSSKSAWKKCPKTGYLYRFSSYVRK